MNSGLHQVRAGKFTLSKHDLAAELAGLLSLFAHRDPPGLGQSRARFNNDIACPC